MKSIYCYINPIIYLRHWKKATGDSYRLMAMASGFKSKTFLFKVLDNRKMYSHKRIDGIGTMLGLDSKKLKYFRIMSFLHHAKAPRVLKKEVLNKFRPTRFRS